MVFRIKEIRRSKGITQDELCERAKISRGTIWRLEHLDNICAMNTTLLRIANVLECSVDDLFLEKGA